MKSKLLILALLFTLIITSGFGCKLVSREVQQKMQPITLRYWRAWDGSDDFAQIIAEYQKIHPNINIEYKKLTYEEYEQALLEAWAEDRGPDLFSINASWLGKYKSKIAPLPPKISLAYPVVKGTIKQETVPEIREVLSLTPGQIKDLFVDTVFADVILDNKDEATGKISQAIYGLPLSVDTLAVFYNKDLLNNAGIAQLANYWNDEQFYQQVRKLTKQDNRGNIIQAGVGLGSGSNITRSSDILAGLMMQNGATIIGNDRISFAERVPEQNSNPGLDAIRFYTDFANPAKSIYTYNTELENSLDLFLNGKLAIWFGYAYHLPTIRAQAPKLNFAVKPFLQIEGRISQVNVANYWLETVALKSQYQAEAWDFIQFATAKPDVAKFYLQATNKPTALKALIEEQKMDDQLGVFAAQLLTAKSWYYGKNALGAEIIFATMLNAIANDAERLEDEVRIAVGKLKQTLY